MAVNGAPEGTPPENTIRGGFIPSGARIFGATIWKSYPYAREWFEDALREAKTGTDHNAKRREIVFAVCFAESYLFEWVHGEVLDSGDYEKLLRTLNDLFPADPRKWRPILDRWKYVTKKLRDDGIIRDAPNFGLAYWEDFRDLVNRRNGLVHARASRPETTTQPEPEKPMPSKDDLDRTEAGWATKVVVKLVRELHKAVGTSPQDWLVIP